MANLLEYVVNVKDNATSTMQQLGFRSVELVHKMQGVQAESVRASSALREMKVPVNTLERQLQKLKEQRGWLDPKDLTIIRQYNGEIKALEKEISHLESTMSSSKIGGWAKDAFSQIPFANLLTNPLAIAATVAGASLKKGIEHDMNKSSFSVLLKSEGLAETMLDDISNIKMDQGALSGAAKQMLGYLVNPNDVIPVLDSIANIAGGDTQKVDSLALAYSQMSSTGKLVAQDFNQMVNAGFNPLSQMAITTGKSISQLKDEMSKGAISSQMVKNAFIDATSEGGSFHGMLDQMNNTLGGKWNSFMTKINNGLIKVYNIIGPVAEKMLDLGGAALDATSNGLGWFFDKLKEGHPIALMAAVALGSLTASMMIMKTGGVIVAGVIKTWTIAQWLLNAAMNANPIGVWIAIIISAIAVIGYMIYRVDGWGKAWEHTISSVKSLWSGYISYLKLGWLSAEHILISGIDKIKTAWYKLKGLWDEEGVSKELEIINKQSDDREKAIKDTSNDMIKNLNNALSSFNKAKNSFNINDKTIGDFGNDLKSKLGISTPGIIAGAATIDSTINSNSNNKQGSATAVATGGTKHNYITINMSDLIGVLNINKAGFKETTQEMEEQATDALLRVLGSAVSAGN